MQIHFTLNHKKTAAEIAPDTLLIDLVRSLGCKSVKRGCETANCGLCTVLMDGKPREVFTRKKELEDIGLAVPDTVSLLFSLREAGMNVPTDAITVKECADAIMKNFT